MVQSKKGIQNIAVSNLYPHPDNPRKDVGDVTELAESISKRGIMQNLTVMPISALTADVDEQPEEVSIKSDFHVLIGYRRLAAAKMAGLKEVPCEIVSKISKKEQVAIMLEENMQREDLTIWEQAQGFQMMLDFGETADMIAEKTGFSKSTIHHRLNLAKLDQNTLKACESNELFQLNLKDLYELEKIADVEERNKILKECNSSRDIAWKAQDKVKEIERKKKETVIIEKLKELGLKKAPKEYKQQRYNGTWEKVKEFELDNKEPKRIKLEQSENEQLYYYVTGWWSIEVVKRAPKVKKKKTAEELRRENLEKAKKEMKKIRKIMDKQRKEFVQSILSGKIKDIKGSEIMETIWNVLLVCGTGVYRSSLHSFLGEKESYMLTQEERDNLDQQIAATSVIHQMLVIMNNTMNDRDLFDYGGKYKKETADMLMEGYKVLEKYGWSFNDPEYEKLLDGTHSLYTDSEERG